MKFLGIVGLFVLGCDYSRCAPFTVSSAQDFSPEKYLVDFGWLFPNGPHDSTERANEFKNAVKTFQLFANVNVTGDINEETLALMKLPRCGQPDQIQTHVGKHISRQKRFVIEGSRWRSATIFYNISRYPSLDKLTVDTQIRKAFLAWEKYINVTFERVKNTSDKVHIDIRFESGLHGDDQPFDGKSGTTAHAYFPQYGGGIHFDADEDWTLDSSHGINLFQVSVHEIGHALGLDHSEISTAVMAPFYKHYVPNFHLHLDDIEAIQKLYGKSAQVLFLCDDPSIDAITTMGDGFIYVFKGMFVYKLEWQRHVTPGYPKAISFEFPGLPDGGIDAAFTRSNNITYFFKDDKIWRFSKMTIDSGFPKYIFEFFLGIPSNLDAAIPSAVDDRVIYFFKGEYYWKFESRKRPPVDKEYPKLISEWKGIPEKGIDAAFHMKDPVYGSSTFFFKAGNYWRLNPVTFSVDVVNPPYPRSSAQWLYGCYNQS